MAINATNNGIKRDIIPAGNYVARCYQMIHIGTIEEVILGEKKILNKVRIGWELPTELKVFSEEKGEQPLVISDEFTLSMNEKAKLRKFLASWRGKDFTEDEAKCFDVTNLLGKTCMLNIIHKPSKKDASTSYAVISSVSPMPKGVAAPDAINDLFVLDYDNFDSAKFNSLPDFIKAKMQNSLEYTNIQHPTERHIDSESVDFADALVPDDLPF